MADPIKRGTDLPIQSVQSIESSPTSGYVFQGSFSGLDADQMLAKMYDYIRAGVSTRFTFANGIAHLEFNDSTQQYSLDVWQIVGNEETRDIFEHPKVSFLSRDLLALVRQYVNDPSLDNGDALDDSDEYQALGANQTILDGFIDLYLRGTTNYRRQQYVLRHTTNAWAGYAGNVAQDGVDQIYTQAKLLAEISDSTWVNAAPAGIVGMIQSIVPDAAIDGYQWGWLKSASTYTTSANNRIEIQTEYCLENWSTLLYEVF